MTRKLLLLQVPLLLGAALLGYVVGTGVTGSSPPEPPRAGPAPGAPERPRGELGRGEGTIRLPDASAFPKPRVPRGTGRITGRVATREGAPVAGVLVRAEPVKDSPRRGHRASGPPEDRDLDDVLRGVAESWHFRREGRRETLTAEDGSYVLKEISDLRYTVWAWAEGYEFRQVEMRTPFRRAGDVADFLAKRVVVLPVRVLTEDGGAPSEARIECESGGEREWERWRPGSPEIAIPPGTWTVRAVAGPGDTLRSARVEVELEVGVRPEPLSLTLERKLGIRGKVTGMSGGIRQLVEVKALLLRPGEKPDPKRLVEEGLQDLVSPAFDPVFSFTDLEPGRYLVGVVTRSDGVLTSEVVEVVDRPVVHDLAVPPPAEDESLLVRVEGPDGKAIEDAAFHVGFRNSSFYPREQAHAAREADGTFRVSHPTPRFKDEGGRHGFLEIRTAKCGSCWVEVDFESRERIRVRLGEPATLTVALEGYAESTYEGITEVHLVPLPGGKPLECDPPFMAPWEKEGGSGGVREFGPIAPGRYRLLVQIETDGFGDMAVVDSTLALKPGPNRREMRLPRLCTLSVTTEGLKDGQGIDLRCEGPAVPEYSSPATREVREGRAKFERLPEGSYVLEYRDAESSGRLEVELSGDRTVHFVVRVVNALRVEITASDGQAAKAGLRTGDLVIGVDGEEFETPAQMAKMMAAAFAKDRAEFLVLRGSKTLTIEFDPRKLMRDPKGWGAEMEPSSR